MSASTARSRAAAAERGTRCAVRVWDDSATAARRSWESARVESWQAPWAQCDQFIAYVAAGRHSCTCRGKLSADHGSPPLVHSWLLGLKQVVPGYTCTPTDACRCSELPWQCAACLLHSVHAYRNAGSGNESGGGTQPVRFSARLLPAQQAQRTAAEQPEAVAHGWSPARGS